MASRRATPSRESLSRYGVLAEYDTPGELIAAAACELHPNAVLKGIELQSTKDRLRAGGSERVPDGYAQRVSKYFESIATKKKPGDIR